MGTWRAAGILILLVAALTGSVHCGNPATAAGDAACSGCKGCAGCSEVKPGDRREGKLHFRATLNESLAADVSLEGAFTVVEAPEVGPALVRATLTSLTLSVGDFRATGAGDALLRIARDGSRVTIVSSTLAPDVLAALRAVELFAGGQLVVEPRVDPLRSLEDALARELDAGSGRARCEGTYVMDGQSRDFRVTARYHREGPRGAALTWTLNP